MQSYRKNVSCEVNISGQVPALNMTWLYEHSHGEDPKKNQAKQETQVGGPQQRGLSHASAP